MTEMPIYEYRCESCAEKFEILTRFAERDSDVVCLRLRERDRRGRLLRRRVRLLRLEPQLAS